MKKVPAVGSDARADAIAVQFAWASRQRLRVDAGYLSAYEDNLRATLTRETKDAFSRGAGSELKSKAGKRPKMAAIHSSSALAANCFDYWSPAGTDRTPLQRALDLHCAISAVQLEAQLPSGMRGIPPTLDVLLTLEDGALVGIESKFTEWMLPKHSLTMQASYFSPAADGSLWKKRHLSSCHAMAESLRGGTNVFRYLDAPQLLKHVLGLARAADAVARPFHLLYLYWDASGDEGDTHREEIVAFAGAVSGEVSFTTLTYQELVARMAACDSAGVHEAYLAYMMSRYGSTPTNVRDRSDLPR